MTFHAPLNPEPVPNADLWEVMMNALVHLHRTGATSDVPAIRATAAKVDAIKRVDRLIVTSATKAQFQEFIERKTGSGTLIHVWVLCVHEAPEPAYYPVVVNMEHQGVPTLGALDTAPTGIAASEFTMVLRYLPDAIDFKIQVVQ